MGEGHEERERGKAGGDGMVKWKGRDWNGKGMSNGASGDEHLRASQH